MHTPHRRSVALALVLPLLFLGCSDDDNPPPVFNASCSAQPLAGSGARVYLECASVSGSMAAVDIYAEGVTDEVDAYNIVLTFSPAIFRYAGFVPTATLFTPNDCGGGATLCLDNLSSAGSGQVVYGVSLIGSNPTGKTAVAKTRIGQLLFEAVAAGATGPQFSGSAQAGCVGNTTTGNALLTVADSGSCTVSVIPGVDFLANNGRVTLGASEAP